MSESIDIVYRTKELLNSRPRSVTYSVIARECGVSERFLALLSRGIGKDYSARRIQLVYEYLTKSRLIAE